MSLLLILACFSFILFLMILLQCSNCFNILQHRSEMKNKLLMRLEPQFFSLMIITNCSNNLKEDWNCWMEFKFWKWLFVFYFILISRIWIIMFWIKDIFFSINLNKRLLIIIIITDSIGLISRVFTNGQGDRGSIPGRVIPKTPKMLLA